MAFLSSGKNHEDWAKDLKQKDFELLCLDDTRKPVTEAQNCHLAIVPNHAVVSRKDNADFVRRMLFNQQVWATEHSVHLQTCTDLQRHTLARSHTLSPWVVALDSCSSSSDERGRLVAVFIFALGPSRTAKWTEKPQTCGHVKGLTKIPWIPSILMVPLGLVLSQK